jgi:hypothetical protein
MTLARDVSKFEVKFRQFLHPTGLFPVEFSCDFKIGKVVVVGIDNGFMWVSYKVRSPSCESVYNGEEFLVVDVPISLRGIEGSGKESDGVELAFLIPLLKDGANSVSRGVAINRESVLESGLSQDRGGANRVHKGVERRFKFIVPVELPSSCAVSDERIEGCGQHAEVANVHAIKIEEAEECSNFL